MLVFDMRSGSETCKIESAPANRFTVPSPPPRTIRTTPEGGDWLDNIFFRTVTKQLGLNLESRGETSDALSAESAAHGK